MPFTVTHVAAAVPVAWLCRWRVPFSALAIGAMLPDVSVFFPALFDYGATHSMRGILTHCIPMGILCYYLYHSFLKRPLADLLPLAASERLRPWTERPIDFSVLSVVAVIACVAVGSITHVVWDAFTHGGRWGVEMFPVLQSTATAQIGIPLRWYAVIQHGSSIVLLPVLLMGFALWIKRQPRPEETVERARMPRSIAWVIIALMVLGMMMYVEVMLTSYPHLRWISVGGIAVKRGGAAAMIVTLLYCSGMHLLWWREKNRQPYIVDMASR